MATGYASSMGSCRFEVVQESHSPHWISRGSTPSAAEICGQGPDPLPSHHPASDSGLTARAGSIRRARPALGQKQIADFGHRTVRLPVRDTATAASLCRAEYSAANEALSMARLFRRDLTGPTCAQFHGVTKPSGNVSCPDRACSMRFRTLPSLSGSAANRIRTRNSPLLPSALT